MCQVRMHEGFTMQSAFSAKYFFHQAVAQEYSHSSAVSSSFRSCCCWWVFVGRNRTSMCTRRWCTSDLLSLTQQAAQFLLLFRIFGLAGVESAYMCQGRMHKGFIMYFLHLNFPHSKQQHISCCCWIRFFGWQQGGIDLIYMCQMRRMHHTVAAT
jgi:hypothetical protein